MASQPRVAHLPRLPPPAIVGIGRLAERLTAPIGARLASMTTVPNLPIGPRPPFGRVIGRIAMAGLTLVLNGCVPQTRSGGLAPTLTLSDVPGGSVAMQNGIPVPSFEVGSRPRVALDGPWRMEQAVLDSDLSLGPRETSLPRIVGAAAGREQPGFDDSGWSIVQVPGTDNPPPDRREIGAWYRRAFRVPAEWAGRALTLKFSAVNYIADVWVNGTWLGYHEGGYTPFAFDATAAVRPGADNLVVVRVDNPPWGTRNDIVPWGLADWWNFGGITRSVWLEASDPLHVVRADVVPHLDGADVSLVLENRSDEPATARPIVEILPARVTSANVLAEDVRSLVASPVPVARQTLDIQELAPHGMIRLDTSIVIGAADDWSPETPSLYVARVVLVRPPGEASPSPGSATQSQGSATQSAGSATPAGSSAASGAAPPASAGPSSASGTAETGPAGPSAAASFGPSATAPAGSSSTASSGASVATASPAAEGAAPASSELPVEPVAIPTGSTGGNPPGSPSAGFGVGPSAAGPAAAPVLIPFDEIDESFGLRQIAVDSAGPGLRLNGSVVTFDGVNLHDQRVQPGTAGVAGRIVATLPTAAEILAQLEEARGVNARLIRSGHTPPDPALLRIADRLGYAIWEEIPLYHYTPLTFGIAMGRGIPQQMLREMILRDMNHPSVLFHGLANESTGGDERFSALDELSRIDHDLDGTRLTGQAAYGFSPTDDTSRSLDVAGFTFYYGVFYGSDPAIDTARALDEAHAAYPKKPILVLEFGHWSDPPTGEAEQVRIFNATAGATERRMAVGPGGFVAGRLWWSLEDYLTMRPQIEIERFGMFAPDGSARPVASAAVRLFGPAPAQTGPSGAVSAGRQLPAEQGSTLRLVGYLAYAAIVTVALLGGVLLVQAALGGRSADRPRSGAQPRAGAPAGRGEGRP